MNNIEVLFRKIVNRMTLRKDKSFKSFIDLFEVSDNKGIVDKERVPEDCPADFKNESGDLDFYLNF